MKKLILGLVFFAACFLTVNAQQRGGGQRPQMDPKKMVENLDKQLNLTDAQEKSITTLYTEFFKESKNDRETSREDRKIKMDQLNVKIKALLTEEQQVKFEKILKERESQQRDPQQRNPNRK